VMFLKRSRHRRSKIFLHSFVSKDVTDEEQVGRYDNDIG
jgi:hypothetical protein